MMKYPTTAVQGVLVDDLPPPKHAFVNEVHAVSCPAFTCPGNKPLTSEAYALLFFNGQFLQERLPQ